MFSLSHIQQVSSKLYGNHVDQFGNSVKTRVSVASKIVKLLPSFINDTVDFKQETLALIELQYVKILPDSETKTVLLSEVPQYFINIVDEWFPVDVSLVNVAGLTSCPETMRMAIMSDLSYQILQADTVNRESLKQTVFKNVEPDDAESLHLIFDLTRN